MSQGEIVANYLESNHWNRRLNEDVMARVAPIGVDADVITPLLEVRPEYLEASMDAIAQAYGSVEQFLADDLRIDVGQLRGHYLED